MGNIGQMSASISLMCRCIALKPVRNSSRNLRSRARNGADNDAKICTKNDPKNGVRIGEMRYQVQYRTPNEKQGKEERQADVCWNIINPGAVILNSL